MFLRRELIGIAQSESGPAEVAAAELSEKAAKGACACVCSELNMASGAGALAPVGGSPKGAIVASAPADADGVDRFLRSNRWQSMLASKWKRGSIIPSGNAHIGQY